MTSIPASLLIAAACLFGEASALRAGEPVASVAGYSFAQYVHDFGRSYAVGSKEYQQRSALFQASLLEVDTVNERNAREKRSWKAKIHPFMDWTHEERKRLHGYKPSHERALLQTGATAFGRAAARTNLSRSWAWGSDGEVSSYENEGPPMRNQGDCGSCWAISAVEAVEAQLQRNGASLGGARVSAQALVDCVPNPRHCGGSGGCDGATGELAYEFMRDQGIPLEDEVPYTAQTASCPGYSQKRVRVSGWSNLPSNQADPLMQALVQQGPVVVAVDGGDWFNYGSGVFDGCSKDADLSHAVLAKGYGEDAGQKYWLIQNSWGSDWGENGNIRLHRHDDESSWCGTDKKPQDGVGCDGGPSEVTVCGMCGLLYDPVIPQGVRVEGGDSEQPAASPAAAASMSAVSVTDETQTPADLPKADAPADAPTGDAPTAKKYDDSSAVSRMEQMLRGTSGPRA